MVAQPGSYQFSCNAGELGRRLGQYGAKAILRRPRRRVEHRTLPQGGFDLRRARAGAATCYVLDAETGKPAVRIFDFSISRTDDFMAVLTPGAIIIFQDGAQIASLRQSLRGKRPQIHQGRPARRHDAAVYHADYATRRLLASGAPGDPTAGRLTRRSSPMFRRRNSRTPMPIRRRSGSFGFPIRQARRQRRS